MARIRITRRVGGQALIDVLCWAVALFAATWFRFDLSLAAMNMRGLAAMIPLAAGAQLISGTAFGLYRGRWRYGSFDEIAALAKAAVLTSAILFFADLTTRTRRVPLSAALAGGFVALVAMSAVRYGWRFANEKSRRPSADSGTRVLIFGAGEAGVQVISAMMRDPNSPYYPVGLLDDDPAKRNLSILGVRVFGNRDRIPEAARHLNADALLLAIPSADGHLVNDISLRAEDVGLRVKVLPPVSELYGAGVGLADIRDVEPADLLGRRPIEIDLAGIAEYLTNKRVLVTGAGGSIGSELCRQIWRFAPGALIMLDRDENSLHGVQLSIEGRALLDSSRIVLCDIREKTAVEAAFRVHQPHVVFHAAALKHLPLLERYPDEALKTNVWGTLNMLDAAAGAGVERFVNISTDKAADPTSVLGYTKRICERLTADVAQRSTGTFLSVRFGNVLGSNGSVLTTFRHQIDAGGPVTVTSPDVTRFFMTIPEAVQLVIQAAAIGRPGEALVLDMGEPVRIAALARRLVNFAARPVEIVFTGLRPGEKCHEVLFGRNEVDRRPVHPLVSHVDIPPLDARRVLDLTAYDDEGVLIKGLEQMCMEDVGLHEA